MGSFNGTYSNFYVRASVSTYCKNTNWAIDHVGTSRSPGSETRTFSTSGIPSNAIIDSVNFSINKVVSGNTVGNSIEYIAEDGTDTIRANNETILNWLNNNRGNNDEYPNITINCWANTTGYPNHTHSSNINTSKLIEGYYKVTYNEISLTVSYHLDMDLTKFTPDIKYFYIYDNFKRDNYSEIHPSGLVSGGDSVLNSTSVSLLNNCIFQGYSSLYFNGSATSNQDNDTTVSYNLIIKKEDGTIIYNEIQNHGYFSLSSNIFSGITATRQINGTNFKAAKIIFYYKVKDVTNRETQATGSIFLIDGYSSPKINNFTISKDGTYAKGNFDATFSEIPYRCSEANGIISAVQGRKNSLTYQKILKNNDTNESDSSSNYPYTGKVTNSYFVENSGDNKISLDDKTDYTLTIKVTDICSSTTSSFNLKPETVFLDIETTGVSIGRQVLNESEPSPRFEVHLPTDFYIDSNFYNGIYVTAKTDPLATNLVDCESIFWGNVTISNTGGNNNQFYVSVPSTFSDSATFNGKATFNGGIDFGESASFDFSQPITFGNDVTFKGNLIFSGSSNLDFSQPIMATGGITVGDATASNPKGATFNGPAIFNGAATFNSSLQFDNATFSSASISSGGTLSIAEGATLDVSGSSTFTENIRAIGGITVGNSNNASNANFYGKAIFKKGVTFEDAVTFSGTDILTFNSSAIFNNGASLSSVSIQSGGTLSIPSTASLSVSGSSSFSKNISANGGITVGSYAVATFNGSANFNNETTFNEAAIFKKEVTFEDAVTFSGTDTLTFSRPITFNGKTTFNAALIAEGRVNFNGFLTSNSSFVSRGIMSILGILTLKEGTTYGETLPTSTNEGQLFFKIID